MVVGVGVLLKGEVAVPGGIDVTPALTTGSGDGVPTTGKTTVDQGVLCIVNLRTKTSETKVKLHKYM